MTNEEILANAPKDGAATHILVDHEHHVTYVKRYPDSGNWFWFHPDSGWLEFDRMPTAQNIQSLCDIRRIVEFEQKLEAAELQAKELTSTATAMMQKHPFILGGLDAVAVPTEKYNDMVKLLNRQRQKLSANENSNCELECGAYGTYCKCKDDQLRQQLNGGE